jgi:hypothetical protein
LDLIRPTPSKLAYYIEVSTIASLKPHFTIIKPGFRYESGTVLDQVENRVVRGRQ